MLKVLIKVRLRAFFTSMFARKRNNAGKGVSKGVKIILIALLSILLAAEFLGLFSMIFYSIGTVCLASDMGWLYVSIAMLIAFAVMFVLSIFSAKAQLYDAKDNDLLLSMPIKPRDILFSRMAVLLLTNYMYEALVLLPAGVIRCILAPVSAYGVFTFLLMALTLPMFALALSCLLAWLIAAISARMKNKNIFTVIFALAFLGLYIVVYTKMLGTVQDFELYAESAANGIRGLGPVYWVGSAVSNGNILHFVLCLLLFTLPLAAVFVLLYKSFIKIATIKVSAKQKTFSSNGSKAKSIRSALIGRELRHFTQSANYMLNSGLGLVFIVGVGVFALIKSQSLREILTNQSLAPIIITGLGCALCFMESMCTMSACTISLEGKNLWIVRSLPVSSREILTSKILFHCMLMFPAAAFGAAALSIAADVGLINGAAVMAAALAYVPLSAYIGLCENLRHPMIDWTDETVAVKQGMSVLFTMLIQMGIGIASIVSFIPLSFIGFPPAAYLFILAAIFAGISVLLHIDTMKNGVSRFESL